MNNAANEIGSELGTAVRVTTDKRGLAARYLVGTRTIENWQNWRIIRGTRQGKKICFDVGDCDRRLLQYQNGKETYGNN
jgi:hypothetical protein